MASKLRTKIIILIFILSLAKILPNNQYFIQSEAAITSHNYNIVQEFHSRYGVEEKLDKLAKSVGDLRESMKFVVSAVRKNHEELKTLRQIVNQSYPNLTAERKDQQNSKLTALEVKCADDRLPENCYHVKECHKHVYSIAIPKYSEEAFPVSCDLQTEDSGWTVIQRRQDGSVNFFRNWTEYVEGFGDLSGEFFIGLEKLHVLTTQGGAQELYIILEDFKGVIRYAKYKIFQIDSKETDYELTVGNYSGDAGDSFSRHSGYKFSTWDRDNDGSEENCAKTRHGGWWYHSCYNSNLNGQYFMGYIDWVSKHGVAWGKFRGLYYSLKYSQMMIRPLQN